MAISAVEPYLEVLSTVNNLTFIQIKQTYADLGTIITGTPADLNLDITTLLSHHHANPTRHEHAKPAHHRIPRLRSTSVNLISSESCHRENRYPKLASVCWESPAMAQSVSALHAADRPIAALLLTLDWLDSRMDTLAIQIIPIIRDGFADRGHQRISFWMFRAVTHGKKGQSAL
jgi:hypothetical protein